MTPPRLLLVVALLLGQAACKPDPVLNPTPDKDDPEPVKSAAEPEEPAPKPKMIDIFMEAARTDIEKPRQRDDESAPQFYGEASKAFFGKSITSTWHPPEHVIANTLAASTDPRAFKALIAWATRATAKTRHRAAALHAMRDHPRPEYLPVVQTILDEAALASHITGGFGSKAYHNVVQTLSIQESLHVAALSIAAAIYDEPSRAFLRKIAMDRTRPGPNPLTLKAFECPKGKLIDFEAQALADLRIMALALLDDIELMRKLAADGRERPLVRQWAREMAKAKTTPPRVDPRIMSTPDFFAYISPCLLPVDHRPPGARRP